jgi:hypothetical protein
MVRVTDPSGLKWSVSRKWWDLLKLESPAFDGTPMETVQMFIQLPLMVMWPFWLAAKWLGVPWTIVIKRNGKQVGREKVRGWRSSGARVDEIARQAAAGTSSLPFGI